MSDVDLLWENLKQSRHAAAFTGAGISTLSGIRDFRGKNGVYLQPWRGYEVEEILSLSRFLKEPELFYAWAQEFIYRLEEFHASIVHQVLAEWEKRALLKSVYTQNIDLLHQKAGSRNVYELHGSPAMHHCLFCGKSFPYPEIAPRVMAGETPHCPCGGVVKPDIVFYGENLPEKVLSQAEKEMAECDLLLVLGSSLTVYPAAALPEITLRHGGKLVLVNDQPTPYDGEAFLRFRDLETCFTALERKMKEEASWEKR